MEALIEHCHEPESQPPEGEEPRILNVHPPLSGFSAAMGTLGGVAGGEDGALGGGSPCR